MSRVALFGNTPDSFSPGAGNGACIARTERFRATMEAAGHEVIVCSPPQTVRPGGFVSAFLRERGPFDCIVAISPFPAEAVAQSGCTLPLWIDMNGMHPAEIQLAGADVHTNRLEMFRMLALERSLLARGDRFSAPSARQSDSILGQLFLLGRLDCGNRGSRVVHPFPHCAVTAPLSTGPESDDPDPPRIISTGSFNSWFDHTTLFRALEYVMERDSRAVFTCSGGAVPFWRRGVEEFASMTSSSRHCSRYDIRGWVGREELGDIYDTATAAVLADIPCNETRLGARTRVIDWVSRGIPVACTRGAEVSEDMDKAGTAIVVPQENPEELGRALLTLITRGEARSAIRKNQIRWCSEEGDPVRVFRPLNDWCSSPERLQGGIPPGFVPKPFGSLRYRLAAFALTVREKGLSEGLRRMAAKLPNSSVRQKRDSR